MQDTTSPSPGTMSTGAALQLLLSYILAGSITLGVFSLLVIDGLQQPVPFLAAIASGSAVGLLFTGNIQYSLYILELTLARFAHGLPVESLKVVWRWPLSALFEHLNTLNQRIKDFEQNKRLTAEFREQLLRQASEAAALEERNRIARDLHDSIKQQIFSISISAAAAKAHWNGSSEDARVAVEDIQLSAKEAQVEMQALLQQLRSSPLENTSLTDALRTQAEALGYRTGACVNIDIGDLPTADRLPPGSQEAIFRMVQEVFSNIARHARANTVWLSLSQKDNALHIEVRDNGQGFMVNTVQKGMGLSNLHERAKSLRGAVEVQSAIGKGTTVHIAIPLLEALRDAQELEQIARENKRAIEQAKRGFQLGENFAPLTIILIVINSMFQDTAHIPLIAIGICVLVVLFGYLQGRYYTTRVSLTLGEENVETLSLRLRAHGVRLWMLRIFVLGLWYALINQKAWIWPYAWLAASIFSLLLIGLFVIEHKAQRRTKGRYYALLPRSELHWEFRQEKQNLARRFRIWLIASGIEAIVVIRTFGVSSVNLSPTTPAGWISYGIITVFISWGITNLVDSIQVKRWEQYFVNNNTATEETGTPQEV